MEIAYGGRVITVGAARQRAVLTVLLLHGNRMVPMDMIIEQVWGDRPPMCGRTAVRNYVARLRKILPEPVLRTVPSGYLLRLGPDDLDMHRFRRLRAQARQVAFDRPADAAAALGEALALWRGPALADLGDAPVRAIEAPRLEDARLTAVEELIDAELRLGRHAELVCELHGLVARYPLREQLAAQLILALHRAGRRVEALATYDRVRATLVREQGLEPGYGLRHLHQRVLRDARDLMLATGAA
jgi:DNA-binding SARP family transcriptional activator